MGSQFNQFDVLSVAEDSENDDIECSNVENNIELPEDHDPDATEYSSSFGGTVSDPENCSGISEAEAESQFAREGGLHSPFDAFESIFRVRKKKLTSHWRAFIRPLLWRCKWAELKMKEIESHASRYSRELETIKQGNQWRTSQCPIEQCGSRSTPFSSHFRSKILMKRRKRKRVEDITDITRYMMHHNLFSYLENRRTDPDATFLPDDVGIPAPNLDKKRNLNNEFGNGSNHNQSSSPIREQHMSLEQVLQRIELVQSRVYKLRGQLEMVILQNAAKFSSSENLNLLAPCEAQTSCAPSPTVSANNGEIKSMGALYPSAQRLMDFDIGDLVLPESVVSSFDEDIPVPDVIESTVGLLSAADASLHQKPLIGDSKDIVLKNTSIHNEAAKGETRILKCSQVKQPELDKGEQDESHGPPCFPASKQPESSTIGAMSQQRCTLNSCLASGIHFPKNKRSRGDRKLGSSGGWSRKCPGEPDSQ